MIKYVIFVIKILTFLNFAYGGGSHHPSNRLLKIMLIGQFHHVKLDVKV